jgi:hypothetical protein
MLELLAAEQSKLQAEKINQQEKLDRGKKEQATLDMQKGNLDADKGRLEERLRTFRDQEKQLQKRLGRQWIRNLLGELEAAEMDQIHKGLLQTRDQLLSDHEKVLMEKAALALRQLEMDLQWKGIQAEQGETSRILNDNRRELSEYLKKEQQVHEILRCYGFDASLIFDHERLGHLFTQHIKELE